MGEDYFLYMDNGVALTPEEVRDRNMWLVWTGGSNRFWKSIIRSTFGAFDLLKLNFNTARGKRRDAGLVNSRLRY